MIFLSLEQLIALHAQVISETGGSGGIRDLGRLESAVASQSQSIFDEELYPTIFDKTAAIIRGVIADHPFVDGNKRTAMLSSLTLLKINGYRLVIEIGEIEDFAVKIAIDRLDVTKISAWLRQHVDSAQS